MSITAKQETVYFSPSTGRRFLTSRAAINKEARAIINKHFPPERGCSDPFCECGDPGWDFESSQPERFKRYYRMLTDALKRQLRNAKESA